MPFAVLLAWHHARVVAAGVAPASYQSADPLAEDRAFPARRNDDLEARRRIAYQDPARNADRFTVVGSTIFVGRMQARM